MARRSSKRRCKHGRTLSGRCRKISKPKRWPNRKVISVDGVKMGCLYGAERSGKKCRKRPSRFRHASSKRRVSKCHCPICTAKGN